MSIPADNEPAMVAGWHALLSMQERGRVTARRQSLAMVGRPIRRAVRTEQEENTDG